LKKILKIFSVIAGGLLFILLFSEQSVGINLPLFGLYVLLLSLVYRKKPINPGPAFYIALGGWLLTSLSAIIFNTALAISMNIISLILLCGLLQAERIKSPVFGFMHSVVIFALAIPRLFSEPFLIFKSKIRSTSKLLNIALGTLIVTGVFALFTILFASSNPVFNSLVNSIFGDFFTRLARLFQRLNYADIFLFLSGAVICTAFFVSANNSFFTGEDARSSDNIYRNRKPLVCKNKISWRGLYYENKLGIILLSLLNLLILIFNIIDIKWLWFDFAWDGDFMKPFVHEGTFILIFSIVLSMTLVLLFFRKNLNFFKKSARLRILVYIWLVQNLVVTASVARRTCLYVEHFNLAYLRIGVFFFLLAVVFGLATVFYKVYAKKSAYYLLSTNTLFVFCGLCLMAVFNWNSIVASYNIRHSGDAYFHRDFMITMPDAVLPLLLENRELFDYPFSHNEYHEYVYKHFRTDSTTNNYRDLLDKKIKTFSDEYPQRSWQSWNYADFISYKKVVSQQITPTN